MSKTQAYSERLNVLIIEDNQGDFVLIEDYLLEQFRAINIIHFSSFTNSINYLQNATEKISVILLDMNLPDLGGIELISGILTHSQRIPIIILTGYSDVDMAKKSLQMGVYDYLIKDEINPVMLHKTITFALNRSSFINQIEDEKDNYESLFNFNPQPTWLLDAQSLSILNANIAAQNKYGFSLNDFLKMSFTQLHPKQEEQIIKHKLVSKAEDFKGKYFTHLLKSGKEIKVNIYFRHIKGFAESELIVQANDISETLEYIKTIEIQNTKLRNIAWTQSHVVRAPLSRILGIVDLLEQQTDNFDEVLFWLKQLRISTDEMDDIVKKIVAETNHIE